MISRVLFLVLLALNMGGACWLYFAPLSPPQAVSMTDAGVPKLILLSEQERGTDAASAELATAPESRADFGHDLCISIGPFSTQVDVRAAINGLTPQVKRIQFREAHATQARGYWVYLPAMKTREQALAMARQLSGKGVRDYYVVTAGDQQNTISLGLFREQVNAEKRRAQIAALGFEPELVARTEELPVYWVDFAQDPHQPVDWRTVLVDIADLQAQPIGCF